MLGTGAAYTENLVTERPATESGQNCWYTYICGFTMFFIRHATLHGVQCSVVLVAIVVLSGYWITDWQAPPAAMLLKDLSVSLVLVGRFHSTFQGEH